MKFIKKALSLLLTAATILTMVCVGTISAGAESAKLSPQPWQSVSGEYGFNVYALKESSLCKDLNNAANIYNVLITFYCDSGRSYFVVYQVNGSEFNYFAGYMEAGKDEYVPMYALASVMPVDNSICFQVVFKSGTAADKQRFINDMGKCSGVIATWQTGDKNGNYSAENREGVSITNGLTAIEVELGSSLTGISSCTISKISNKVYTGSARTPDITIKNGTTKLVKGTDYTLSYKNNKKIGTATVTITGKGDYTGTETVTFKIVPKKTTLAVAEKADNKAKFTWNAVSGAEKYQIYYSENGGSYKKMATVSGTKYYSSFSKVVTVK